MTRVSRRSMRWRTVAMATAAGAALSALTPSAAPARLTGRFWSVDPVAWKAEGRDAFPEDETLQGRPDFGIAFSGGGTRAAAATIGQLRGLEANGWLAKVRYVAAVSGGSWSVVPYVFTDRPLPDLLGTSLPIASLTKAELEKEPPVGSLARSVVRSKLGAHSAVEAAEFVARRRAEREDAPAVLRLLVDRAIRGGTDRTFADLLRRVFLDPVLAKDSRLRYAWDDASVTDFVDGNATLSYGDFLRAARPRPFPIVGGTIIATHPAYEYPVLIPLELTPLYSGVRQRFGPTLGGIYVRPFVYGSAADVIVKDRIAVTDGTTPFTLADAIAISGAAPLLTLYLGQPHPLLKQGVQFFPTFKPFSVVDESLVVPDVTLSHGDGGFTDNLGLMPLLARQVRNVIVFVNAKDEIRKNTTIESFFRKVQRQSGSGDLSNNTVFDEANYLKLRNGLEAAAKSGAAVHCERGWSVKGNEVYNIRPYSKLNICWVYNLRVPIWETQLPADAQQLLKSRRFRHFPWYSTFEENKPYVIRLNSAQVNALSHLAEWTVTNDSSRKAIEAALGDALR